MTPSASCAVAVTCIDGRTHDPLVRWIRSRFDVEYVDLVTEPGADAALAACPRRVCDGVRDRLEVSLGAHAPCAVVVAGHDDCAANPVPSAEHRRQLIAAVAEVGTWAPAVPVFGVWIEADGGVTVVTARDEGIGSEPLM